MISKVWVETPEAICSLPPGWQWCEAAGWYWVSPALEVGTEDFSPLGPFQTIPAMVDAANRVEMEARP